MDTKSESNVETLGRLAIGVSSGAGLLDTNFYYISGEGEDEENEEE